MKLKAFALSVLPPAVARIVLWAVAQVRWLPYHARGRFRSWPEAERSLARYRQKGYNNQRTADKYVSALMQQMQARESGPGRIPPRQLQNAFAFSLLMQERGLKPPIRILDFGGAAGSEYVSLVPYLPWLESCAWCVCDLPEMVTAASSQLAAILPRLRYVSSVADAGSFDVVFTSGALQYIENWETHVAGLLDGKPAGMVVTRVPLISSGPSFVTAQNAGETKYPSWVWEREDFLRPFLKRGTLPRVEWKIPEDHLMINGRLQVAEFSGFVFVPSRG